MGRFDRKLQRKHSVGRSPVVLDRRDLARNGFTLVPEDAPALAELPPLVRQIESMAIPILDMYPGVSDEMLSHLLGFVVLGWNLGFMAVFQGKGASPEQMVKSFFGPQMATLNPTEREQMMGMSRSLIRMRQEFFGHDPRLIEQFAIQRTQGGYAIQVAGVAAFRNG